ncbi:hypothetical protein GCM10010532_103050 [Dactylosporangium siamense]
MSPWLRSVLHPRRGGIVTPVRPLAGVEEAWAGLRRGVWSEDRAISERGYASRVWELVTSSSAEERAVGLRLLDPVHRIGTAEEDRRLVETCRARFEYLSGPAHEWLADFIVAAHGLVEGCRRILGGLHVELPYVGVGVFGRLRQLLVLADEPTYAQARDALLEVRDRLAARHTGGLRADLFWVTSFLLPLGPLAGDEERRAHGAALRYMVEFGHGDTHACGLAAGDLDTLERFLAANKRRVRWEFFGASGGGIYLASILEIAGAAAGPVLAGMKPAYPFEDHAHHNGVWCGLLAHVDDDAARDALRREREAGHPWATLGPLTDPAAFEPGTDPSTVTPVPEGVPRDYVPPAAAHPVWLGPTVPAASAPDLAVSPAAALAVSPATASAGSPTAALAGSPAAALAVVPVLRWRDEEREAADRQSTYEDGVQWDGVPISRCDTAQVTAWLEHREHWALPTTLPMLALAPLWTHERLMALGFEQHHYWVRLVPLLLLRHGTGHVAPLLAAFADPRSVEPALQAAQPVGHVSLTAPVVQAFAGKKLRRLARSWLLRHPAHAAAGAVALWSSTPKDAAVARVLRYLDAQGQRPLLLTQAGALADAAGGSLVNDLTALLDQDPGVATKLPAYVTSAPLPPLVASTATTGGTVADVRTVAAGPGTDVGAIAGAIAKPGTLSDAGTVADATTPAATDRTGADVAALTSVGPVTDATTPAATDRTGADVAALTSVGPVTDATTPAATDRTGADVAALTGIGPVTDATTPAATDRTGADVAALTGIGPVTDATTPAATDRTGADVAALTGIGPVTDATTRTGTDAEVAADGAVVDGAVVDGGVGAIADAGAVEGLLVRLAVCDADSVHPGVLAAREAWTPESRAAFALELYERWLAAGAPAADGWCMQAVGLIGDDAGARRVAADAKHWPGQGASARAQAALDALRHRGTDAALIELNLLAEKSRFPVFKSVARQHIEAIADLRGLTPDELADRLVPTLGLDDDGGTVDTDAGTFRIAFDHQLLPVVRDAAGRVHADLPKPARGEDKQRHKRAKDRIAALRKEARASASLHVSRLERAMCTGRRVPADVFLDRFATHPWMSHLARRLVWGAFDGTTLVSTVRVAEDGTLATVTDEPATLPPGATLGVLHPLEFPTGTTATATGEPANLLPGATPGILHPLESPTSILTTNTLVTGTVTAGTIDAGTLHTGTLAAGTIDAGTLDMGTLAAWAEVFADYELLQPFEQLGRPFYELAAVERTAAAIDRFEGHKTTYAVLRGLERRGWIRWYDAAVQMAKPLGGGVHAVLETDPGWHASDTVDSALPQTVGSVVLAGAGNRTFADLPRVAFSELIHDLRIVT